LFVGAGQSDHDRNPDVDALRGGDDPVGDVVAAGDAAEDIEQDDLDVRVGCDDLERRHDLVRVRGAADVEEVRGLSAVVLDQIHGRHGEARTVHAAPDVPVELH